MLPTFCNGQPGLAMLPASRAFLCASHFCAGVEYEIMPERLYRDTELKTALNCLVAYVGMLAFSSPRGSFGEWAERHYESLGHRLTPERIDLLLDLKPLVVDAPEVELSALIARLETLGWTLSFLRREIAAPTT